MCNFRLLKLDELKKREAMYPVGTRIELISMDDPYNKSLHEGSRGTITRIDPFGDIEVDWDSGSSLKLIYGEDRFKVIKDTDR